MRTPRFKPGDRVVVARGPGAGLAGVVIEPARNEPPSAEYVTVIFDREPSARYRVHVAGLDRETIPKKPRRPSVRRPAKRRRRG
jgi:hypothetical protein